jgi:predicted phosphodiesterase
LNLLHLSDIHFNVTHDGGQLDPDGEVRRALVRDFEKRVLPQTGPIDALLITGDIAFSGKKAEYEIALAWIAELCGVCGCEEEAVWMVPGNHDVDHSVIRASKAIQLSHEWVRGKGTAEEVKAELQELLRDGISGPALMSPIEEYNLFAGPYGCTVSAKRPAWCTAHEAEWQERLKLNDDTPVHLHGLTSVLISGLADRKAGLALGHFQAELNPLNDADVRIVLCHHPYTWFIDGNPVRDLLKGRAHVVLFGHEHEGGLEQRDNSLWVFAGAVHPARNENQWEPRYNVLRLDVEQAGASRKLAVEVFPRRWDRANSEFEPKYKDGAEAHRYRLELPERPDMSAAQSPEPPSGEGASTGARPTDAGTPPAFTLRRLRYRFLTLPWGIQVKIAQHLNLFAEEDRGIKDPELFRRVLERARAANSTEALWNEIEKRHGTLEEAKG